jgi:hypothetical protein
MEDGKLVFSGGRLRNGQDISDRNGYRERMDNLKWSLEHCGGVVRVVIAKAKDPSADVREIDKCWPKDWPMRIIRLNDDGEFRLERFD